MVGGAVAFRNARSRLLTLLPSLLGPAEWHRRVWRLALPIMIANISTPLLGLVDTAVVGHLDAPHYLGAVAVGALVFSFLFWGFGFLRMSTTGLTAQAWGADDPAEMRAVLGRALLLAAAIGVALVALQRPIGAASLGLFDASAAVEGHAADYIAARIWGAPATLGNYALLGWFLGMQRAGWALALQLVLNGTNIVLDLVFVIGLDQGVVGVGRASAIAEWTALAVGLGLVARLARRLPGGWSAAAIRNRTAFRRLIGVNADIMIRTLCLIAAFAIFTNRGARQGDTVLAANAVLQQFQLFLAYALDGFAHAAEALVGRTIGARRRDELARAVRVSTIWAAATAAGFGLAYGLAGGLIIDLLTGLPEVRAAARTYLPWMIALPVLSVWSYQLDGVFLGATWTGALRNAMIASLAVFLAAVWVLQPAFGNHGLWAAFAVFTVARAATLAAVYPRLARRVTG
ncbi:MAG: MATE family efflux transporter [Alphaproteobacteria bacterium]|jgi:MATE family multidrug resistance protein|nr:MATE family efflux transporter [Alphaproteobacteria bacterium]